MQSNPTASSTSPDEWISANEAVKLLSQAGQNPESSKSMFAEALREGELQARAEAVWLSEHKRLNEAWRSHKFHDDVERNILVPTNYWRSEKQHMDDRTRWRWSQNKFFYTIRKKPLKRRMFVGVEFSVSDVRALLPLFTNEKQKRGPDKDVLTRDRAWLTVLDIALNGRLTVEHFTKAELLKDEIGKLMQKDAGIAILGENKRQQIASQVLNHLRKRSAL